MQPCAQSPRDTSALAGSDETMNEKETPPAAIKQKQVGARHLLGFLEEGGQRHKMCTSYHGG